MEKIIFDEDTEKDFQKWINESEKGNKLKPLLYEIILTILFFPLLIISYNVSQLGISCGL